MGISPQTGKNIKVGVCLVVFLAITLISFSCEKAGDAAMLVNFRSLSKDEIGALIWGKWKITGTEGGFSPSLNLPNDVIEITPSIFTWTRSDSVLESGRYAWMKLKNPIGEEQWTMTPFDIKPDNIYNGVLEINGADASVDGWAYFLRRF